MGLFDFVGDVVQAALPIVGGLFGGPVGAMAGSAFAGPASELFSQGIPDFLRTLIDSISPQHQCQCPTRPSPWTPPCDPRGPAHGSSGPSFEDRLTNVGASLDARLDEQIRLLEEGGDDLKPGDVAKIQAEIQKITRMQDMITNLLKTLHDTDKGIIANLR